MRHISQWLKIIAASAVFTFVAASAAYWRVEGLSLVAERSFPGITHLTVYGYHAIDCKPGQTMVARIRGDTADVRCEARS